MYAALFEHSPKRINFIAIQSDHKTPCEGYHAPLFSTGYESVVGHRTSGMFCHSAKQNGSVQKKTEKAIQVKYEDGTIDHIELGRIFGKAAGLTIPHDIVSDLKVGDKFKEGWAVAYHSGFFEQDWLNPGHVVLKSYCLARTVLWEADTTFEDASVISTRLAEKVVTKTTDVKNIIVRFDDEVTGIIKAGDKVDYDTVLCYILDKVAADAGVFDEQTIKTLKMIDTQTPKAGTQAVVDKVEFYYHGLKEDLSKTLTKLANACEAEYADKAKQLNKTVYSGQVDGSLRINGDALDVNTACIRVYMTSRVPAGIGDKGVFSSQLKTVYSDVAEQDYMDESGEVVDALFGGQSVLARIVKSAVTIASMNSALYYAGKKAADIYFGKE